MKFCRLNVISSTFFMCDFMHLAEPAVHEQWKSRKRSWKKHAGLRLFCGTRFF